jgi:hypothetical protein
MQQKTARPIANSGGIPEAIARRIAGSAMYAPMTGDFSNLDLAIQKQVAVGSYACKGNVGRKGRWHAAEDSQAHRKFRRDSRSNWKVNCLQDRVRADDRSQCQDEEEAQEKHASIFQSCCGLPPLQLQPYEQADLL